MLSTSGAFSTNQVNKASRMLRALTLTIESDNEGSPSTPVCVGNACAMKILAFSSAVATIPSNRPSAPLILIAGAEASCISAPSSTFRGHTRVERVHRLGRHPRINLIEQVAAVIVVPHLKVLVKSDPTILVLSRLTSVSTRASCFGLGRSAPEPLVYCVYLDPSRYVRQLFACYQLHFSSH
jgi:hypothetical protein